MSFTGFISRIAAPAPKPENFNRIMFVGPHPDDIEVGCGATAAKLAAAGKQICYLICTDGRYGDEFAGTMTTTELIETRRQETISAAAAVGVEQVKFLGLSDGGFYDSEELVGGIAGVVGEFKPEIIFTVDPDVSSECHADHVNVGQAVKKVAFYAPFKGIMAQYGAEPAQVQALAFFMTAKPNRYVNTRGYLKKQLEVLFSCFPSQYPPENPAGKSVALYLKLRAYEFGLRKLCGTAEGFRVLGTTQMHCLPEAGR